jgi:hypothetical protein
MGRPHREKIVESRKVHTAMALQLGTFRYSTVQFVTIANWVQLCTLLTKASNWYIEVQ